MNIYIKNGQRRIIFESALKLFADKGYQGTSIREIAKDADVNIAMINYYFGSKVGLLTEIIEEYFRLMTPIFEKSLEGTAPLEVKIENFIRSYINFLMENTDFIRVVFNEIPFVNPDIAHLQAKKIQMLQDSAKKLLMKNIEDEPDLFIQIDIIWPSIIGMINFHFRMKHIYEMISDRKFDDIYYENFVEKLTDFVLNGVRNLGN